MAETVGAYGVLGLDPTADDLEIHNAYRALAKVLHPDRGGDRSGFENLSTAYEQLRTPQRRAEHDRALLDLRQSPPPTRLIPEDDLAWQFIDLLPIALLAMLVPALGVWTIVTRSPLAIALLMTALMFAGFALVLWRRSDHVSS